MLMTPAEYVESLRKLNTRVYMFGEKVDNWVDHPIIRPSINCVAMTYGLAQDPQYKDLMTATSNLTGETVNRFSHLHQSTQDLVNKVKMQRLCGQKTASCFQRCVGMDAFNAVYSTTFEIDEAHGTNYHENFVNFLKYVQEKDLVVDGAMTDPKGDRSKGPSDQADLDLFLRIVEKREDGIVVRGAKVHQTGTINSHEHIIMPTMALKEGDEQFAVSFACPSDVEGMYMIYGRQSCDTRKLEDGADIDLGSASSHRSFLAHPRMEGYPSFDVYSGAPKASVSTSATVCPSCGLSISTGVISAVQAAAMNTAKIISWIIFFIRLSPVFVKSSHAP